MNHTGTLVKLSTLDLHEISLTRRLGVCEERSSGWRTRCVDNFTELGINQCNWSVDSVAHYTVDDYLALILFMLELGGNPELWSSAHAHGQP